MKLWITKYALTHGIQVVNCKVEGYVAKGPGLQYFLGEGREWHRTSSGAADQAEKMRINMIASLRKSIAKLEAMSFDAAAD